MKKVLLCLCLPALLFATGFGQAPQWEIKKLPGKYPDRNSVQYQGNWTDFYLPGRGVLRQNGVEIRKAGNSLADVVRINAQPRVVPGSMRPMPVDPLVNANRSHDPRNLPLSPSGKLLSPDGFEVEFGTNPNDPGICATPYPKVTIPPNAAVAANCPFAVPCDNPVNRDAAIPGGADPIKYIKINWIVVRSSGGGASSNIDQARVDQLMTEVNADFLPWRIQFCSDPVTFVTDDAMYNLNVGTEDGTLKTTYGTTPTDWVNCYVVGNITNPSAGGYARFPYDPFGGYNIRGGVVLARGNMFVGTHTLAHELGHTFGLYHTFHGVDEVTPCTNCYEDMGLAGQDTEGDWCSDTRPHPTNSNICGDAGTDGCTAIPFTGAPVDNHMSYSFCTSVFTAQQAGRMHCMIDAYLTNWVNYGNGTCGAAPPVASFTCSPTLWQAPSTVTFTDWSVPGPTITNWTWNFDVDGIGGATPSTWTGGPGVGDVPPPVVFDSCGYTYYISLQVTNANGTHTVFDSCVTTLCPAGDCDTLFSHWNTPVSTPSIWTFAPNDYITGIPAPTLQGGPGTIPMGFYEEYITPNPGVTTVGAALVGLGSYLDPDSNTTLQVVVYNCDQATGLPAGPALTGIAGINPGHDLGVPGGLFFAEYWFPFDPCDAVVDSATFLVGVEIFPGNAADALVVVASDGLAGQGQGLGLNWVATNGFGYINYLAVVGLDFDLEIIPMLGPWQTEFFINGLGSAQTCDTTLVMITDSAFYHECLTSVEVKSDYAGSITGSTLDDVDTLFILYTDDVVDTISFCSVNWCGRTDTITYFLTYPFDTTPNPVDFTMNLTNPICMGTPITFTATPAGAADYTWDFGDGTVISSGASTTQAHTYAAPGLYYVTLTVTNATTCSATTTKLDFVEIIDCTVNAPIAGFDPQPDTGCVNQVTQFVDTSQGVPDPPTGWFWAFDDGTFSLLQNPTHTYTAPGTYNVMLVASNAGGTDTIYYQVVILALPCVLPTDIVLKAQPVGSSVVLSWETPSDANRISFEVERSYDGQLFTKIGDVAWDEGDAPNLYSFIDEGPDQGRTIYYRLNEIDQNGNQEFSNVASARIDAVQDEWISVYPNPIKDGNLNIDAYLLDSDDLSVKMYDAVGRVVYESSQSFGAGVGRFVFNTSDLAEGAYFVRVTSSKGVQVKKVIVE